MKRNGGDRDKIESQFLSLGVTWDTLRRELRDQLLAQRVRSRRVVRRATVTEVEVDQYLTQNRDKFDAGLKYHAFHLAVMAEPTTSPAAWEEAKREIESIRRRVGMVFQSFNLFPQMTVRQNLILAPMTALKVPRAEAEGRARTLLERVGIADQIDKYPSQLSGGQQQRVAIARALAM